MKCLLQWTNTHHTHLQLSWVFLQKALTSSSYLANDSQNYGTGKCVGSLNLFLETSHQLSIRLGNPLSSPSSPSKQKSSESFPSHSHIHSFFPLFSPFHLSASIANAYPRHQHPAGSGWYKGHTGKTAAPEALAGQGHPRVACRAVPTRRDAGPGPRRALTVLLGERLPRCYLSQNVYVSHETKGFVRRISGIVT